MSQGDDPLRWFDDHPDRPDGSRAAFDRQLQDIDTALVSLASLVADRIRPVTTAFLAADVAGARRVAADDVTVEEGCIALEERCLELLARQAPVAGDLRHVVAVLHSVADVNRASDLLRHVAKALTWVYPPSTTVELRDRIAALGEVSARIFHGASAAWHLRDALAAVELQHVDDDADRQQAALLRDLYLGGYTVEEAVSLALVSRYYERIADHGVAVARQVAYFVTGDRPAPV